MSISTDTKKENEQFLVTPTIFNEQIELDARAPRLPSDIFSYIMHERLIYVVCDPNHILFNGSIPR
jgi:hypothetical protein